MSVNARYATPGVDRDARTDTPCAEDNVEDVPTADSDRHRSSTSTSTPAWIGEREGLTAHEGAIVSLMVLGLSNKEIAGALHTSTHSIRTDIRSACRKMGVASRAHGISWGVSHGFQLTARAARLPHRG